MDRAIGTLYRHEQTVAATVWTINHNLGRYPIIDVFISVDGQLRKVMPSEVTFVNINSCTVTFTSARAGFATVA